MCIVCKPGYDRTDEGKCIDRGDDVDRLISNCEYEIQVEKGKNRCYQCDFGYISIENGKRCLKLEENEHNWRGCRSRNRINCTECRSTYYQHNLDSNDKCLPDPLLYCGKFTDKTKEKCECKYNALQQGNTYQKGGPKNNRCVLLANSFWSSKQENLASENNARFEYNESSMRLAIYLSFCDRLD